MSRAALEGRLTWLWSTPRSGAALLLELIAYPLRPDPDASLGFRPPPARATLAPNAIPIAELCFAAHFAPWPGEPVQAHDRWIPGTLLNLSEGRPPYFLSKQSEGAWRPLLRDLALGRIEATETRACDHVRDLGPESPIVIKESLTTHGADRVMGLLPGSRALVIVRDPRDAVASQLCKPDGFEVEADVGEDRVDRVALVERSAKLWAMSVDACSAALAQHEQTLSLRVRLEDLLAEPEAELARVIDWIGLERTSSEMAEAVERSTIGEAPPDREHSEHGLETAPGAWRDELSGDEAETVVGIAGRRLAELGYLSG